MKAAARIVMAYFESKEMKCQEMEGRENVLWMGFRLDNVQSVKVILDFTAEGDYVSFRSYNLCGFPQDKVNAMYKICSELNKKFKWVKFYVDESDNTITVQDDAIIQLDSAGPECFELVMRMVQIIDEAYPAIMKAIWQ